MKYLFGKLNKLFFMVLKAIIIVLLVSATIYPLWHVVMYSLSESELAATGGMFLWVRGFTLKAYKYILRTSKIYRVIFMSFAKTLVGTLLSLTLTVLMAYPLAQKGLKGRRTIMFLAYFTMLFGGGMIPTFLVVKNLHLLDTFWAYVIPSAMSVYNMLVMRNYFAAIPSSLTEAAYLDGANHVQILTRVVLPLSKASIATIALLDVRGLWNSYMDGILYINDSNLELLQVYLRRLILIDGGGLALGAQGIGNISSETAKMTVITIAMIPVLLLYVLLQKYFVQGMTVGAVKG